MLLRRRKKDAAAKGKPARMTHRLDLSAEEVQRFHDDGFVVINRPLLRPETIQKLQQSMEKCFRGDFDLNIYPDEWHWREGYPDGPTTKCLIEHVERSVKNKCRDWGR